MFSSGSCNSLAYSPMDLQLKELLHVHRNKFAQIDVERLIPFLKDTGLLTQEDVDAIRRNPGLKKIYTLLDILPSKGSQAFQTLCLALENTSPHLLTVMLLAASQRMQFYSSRQGSISAGVTSDSECEDKKSTTSSGGGGELIAGSSPGMSGSGVRLASSSPPQVNLVSSQDYNMEQSNVALLKAELKIVSKDRDMMKKELKKAIRDREESGSRSTQYHIIDQSSGSLGKHNIGLTDKGPPTHREFENLKLQCEKAILDNQTLRKEKMDLNRKYDTALKDVEYYRSKERNVYTTLQNLRLKCEEVVSEKQNVEHEMASMKSLMEEDRKEIEELRQQQQETMTQDGPGEAINQLYVTTLRKYDALKDEYDLFRKRYSDIAASHSNNISKLELSQEEVSRVKKQYDEVHREKNCLKQQCTEVIRKWDSALRDKNKLHEELQKIKEQHNEAINDKNSQLMRGQHIGKDLKRLQEERNAAMQEYTLIMSERDSVHKEIDKLQEELSIANQTVKSIEHNQMEGTKEKESLQLQLETLKREITSSLHDRDKAIKELNEIRERFGAKDDTRKEWELSYKDYDAYKLEREQKLKDGVDHSVGNHELYSKTQKDRLDNLDQANQEIDRIRKNTEKLQSDLQEAQREAEVSQRRRDWAFNERDKIVLERESIRAHCDILRHERDRAVSELAESLRDSDDMTKQRNEAEKQLKELKEKLETEQEKCMAAQQLATHNSSRDSAIDTDMHEWEIDTLQVQMGMTSEKDLGLDICGGSEDPHYGSNDGAVFVSGVTKDSPYDGKLRIHDQLLQVNGFDCQGANHASIFNTMINGSGWANITIRRRKSQPHTVFTAHIHCPRHCHHGITLQSGFFISNILPGSPASRDGSLHVGDRLISVNGKPVSNIVSPEEVQTLVDNVGEVIQLAIVKASKSSSMSAAFSSSSSSYNMAGEEKAYFTPRNFGSQNIAFKDTSSRKDLIGVKLSRGLTNPYAGEEGARKLGSSERVVYNVTKVAEEKASGHWSPFRNIVKPRRHSKERGENKVEAREKDDKKKDAHVCMEQQNDALAELDSVLDSCTFKPIVSPDVSLATKRPKKKEKSGGTWPKCRGVAPHMDVNTGTIKPGQWRKERPPLSMYLSGVTASNARREEQKVYDSYLKYSLPRNTTTRNIPVNPRSNTLSIFKNSDSGNISMPYNSADSYSSVNVPRGYPEDAHNNVYPSQDIYCSLPRHSSIDRKLEDCDKERHHSSTDTSLDFSVRSGNVGKEELENYAKNRAKYAQSDSEGNLLPMDNLDHSSSLSPPYSKPSPLPHLGERIPSSSRISHSHYGMYAPAYPPIRVSHSFAPYSYVPQYGHSHPHTSLSSPIYSHQYATPAPLVLPGAGHYLPPPRSRAGIMSSPCPEKDTRSYHDYQVSSSPSTSIDHTSIYGMTGFHHSASPSVDSGAGYYKRNLLPHPKRNIPDDPPTIMHGLGPPSYHEYQKSTATLTRKKEGDRIRLPRNTPVNKMYGEKATFSDRGSEISSDLCVDRDMSGYSSSETVPMGIQSTAGQGFAGVYTQQLPRGSQQVTEISHSVHNHHLLSFHILRKPQPGDIRNIHIEKELEPLGIQIRCLDAGGVFVSSVVGKSLAEQVGICIGDQLLEVCGINMRSAIKQVASSVLSQCTSSVTILVQFNPEKYFEAEGWEESSSGGSLIMGSRSGTPTPRNSPKCLEKSDIESDTDELPLSGSSTLRAPLDTRDLEHSLPPSTRSTLSRSQGPHRNSLNRQDTISSRRSNSSQNSDSSKLSAMEVRRVFVGMNKSQNLGIQMVGGNAVGIFVHSVLEDSPAANSDLRPGDKILQYNDVDLRQATAEQAAFELAKPAENVTMVVKLDFQTYSNIKDQPGDSFYIKTFFDRHDTSEPNDLRFRKEDILYVDNTMYNNRPGQWRAWLIDADGQKRHCGTIPSKEKVEEEISYQRNLTDSMDRRGSTTMRRSFFRRKKHSRSSSRDSKELASYSDGSLNSYGDTNTLSDDSVPLSYVRVQRLDYLIRRPVVLVGPLWELVCEKLIHDFPPKYTKCVPKKKLCSQSEVEAGLQNNIIDYRRKGTCYEVTFLSQITDICDQSSHGILDISLNAIERLQKHNIYPIVLVLKFKHYKHIRDMSDNHFATHERLSQTEAKEMHDLTNKLEQDYKHLISATITAGVNMAYVCSQVEAVVQREQSKTLWVSSGPI